MRGNIGAEIDVIKPALPAQTHAPIAITSLAINRESLSLKVPAKPHWCEIRKTVFSSTRTRFPFHTSSAKKLTLNQTAEAIFPATLHGRFITKGDFSQHNAVFRGTAPGEDRTHNLWLRRPTLYPVELRARVKPKINAI
jgi:hypothetical protein